MTKLVKDITASVKGRFFWKSSGVKAGMGELMKVRRIAGKDECFF